MARFSVSQGRRVRIEAARGPPTVSPDHARHSQHLARVVLDGGAHEGLGADDADKLAVLDDGELAEVVVALESGALGGRGIGRHGCDGC